MDNLSFVESIFFAALEKATPEQQAAYLDEACGGDAELRRHVERFLHAQPKVGSFLENPAAAEAGTIAQQPITEGPGTMIGCYKLLQILGEGGMGVVYMAEQQEPVRRKVALKIIKPGLDSREVIARFEAERQALAMMDHINIAKVLDAGATDTGRPYFVMELVHGVPITKYCDDKRLTPRQRLELFIPVCQAVQHAHQKGIIHRDIKPSNVMVTMYDDKPVPKIIDFGVAKAIEQRLTEKSLFTQYGALVGTFEYMSPEQAELNAFGVDTRSDIYSLGVLLYELLTGTTPLERLRLREAGYGEIVRLIREEEPVRPSLRLSTSGAALAGISRERGTEPAKLTKVVRGDLDWIVMRCLEKDRARRYDTAIGLAQDIQHYLAEEPVLACPPSALYRLQKMARRNKAAMATAALVAASLLLGTAVSAWQALRAAQAEGAALAARDEEARQRLTAEQQRGIAEGAAKTAWHAVEESIINEKKAAASAALATEKEQLAIDQAKIADDERVKADVERQKAQQNWTKAEWGLYASHIAAAQGDWEANNLPRLHHYLSQCRAEFRGWEHDYLWTLANPKRNEWRAHAEALLNPVAFSPDGSQLATASNEVKVWDLASGKNVLTLEAHTNWVSGFAFSPDGKILASASMDSSVVLWDLKSGKKLRTFMAHTGGARSVAFSPGGTLLATGGSDKTVKLWDLVSGQLVQSLEGHTDWVTRVSFNRDGKLLASSGWSKDGSMRLWDVASGKEVRTFPAVPRGGQPRMAFSPDGKRLASASGPASDVTVRLWDVASGEEILRHVEGTGYVYLAFSPDSNILVIATDRLADANKTPGRVKLWDVTSGKTTLLKGQTNGIRSVAFSPDGKRIATGCIDGTVALWDTEERDYLTFKAGSPMAMSSDGQRLATSAMAGGGKAKSIIGKLLLWDTFTGKRVLDITVGKTDTPLASGLRARGITFSPDGTRVAASTGTYGDGRTIFSAKLRLWYTTTGEEVLSIKIENDTFGCVAFSPDGKFLAGSAEENTVKLLDANDGKEVRILMGHTGTVQRVAFSTSGTHLASASKEEVFVWDVASGKRILALDGRTCVAFSSNGKILASASADNTMKLWDTASGQELAVLKGHTGSVGSVAFSPDGKRLASASVDKTVKLWETATGQEVLTLKGHSVAAASVAFSPDGKRLVSGGADGTIIIWDASKSMKKLEQK